MEGHFRRNLLLVALAHLLALAAFFAYEKWQPKEEKTDVMWMDGGATAAAAAQTGDQAATAPNESQAAPSAAVEQATPQDEAPAPTPEKTAMNQPQAPSELLLISVTPTPEPDIAATPIPPAEATPTPTPRPRPTPSATPEETPTPKPKPKHKPSPKPSPTPHHSPKHKPKPKPSETPDDTSDDEDATPAKHKHKAKPAPSADDGDTGDDESASPAKSPGKTAHGGKKSGEGEGTAAEGTGKGSGHTGGGATGSDFGWYYSMIHDRFYSQWEQPTSVVSSGQPLSALVKIRIEKDGRISDVSLAKSSGNAIVDDSVMTAARHVTQIDPLPDGLGNGDAYEIKINFELSQNNQ